MCDDVCASSSAIISSSYRCLPSALASSSTSALTCCRRDPALATETCQKAQPTLPHKPSSSREGSVGLALRSPHAARGCFRECALQSLPCHLTPLVGFLRLYLAAVLCRWHRPANAETQHSHQLLSHIHTNTQQVHQHLHTHTHTSTHASLLLASGASSIFRLALVHSSLSRLERRTIHVHDSCDG